MFNENCAGVFPGRSRGAIFFEFIPFLKNVGYLLSTKQTYSNEWLSKAFTLNNGHRKF
jgi:hypothetical protein